MSLVDIDGNNIVHYAARTDNVRLVHSVLKVVVGARRNGVHTFIDPLTVRASVHTNARSGNQRRRPSRTRRHHTTGMPSSYQTSNASQQ